MILFIHKEAGEGNRLNSDSPPLRSCLFLADKVIFWLVLGAQGRVRVRSGLSGPDPVLCAESWGVGKGGLAAAV